MYDVLKCRMDIEKLDGTEPIGTDVNDETFALHQVNRLAIRIKRLDDGAGAILAGLTGDIFRHFGIYPMCSLSSSMPNMSNSRLHAFRIGPK